jgi:hypothetical protein
MPDGTVYIASALVATAGSIIGLTLFAKSAFDSRSTRTLSEMAATSPGRMLAFRAILLPCSALFLITLVWYVAPISRTPALVIVPALAMCLSEMVLAIIPAKGGWEGTTHNSLAYVMGASMYALVTLFWISSQGGLRLTEGTIAVLMTLLFFGTTLDRRRFVFYELPYIYLSHISIVAVALAAARF